MNIRTFLFAFAMAGFVITSGCQGEPADTGSDSGLDLSGRWRANLNSPGGELPFFLEIASEEGVHSAVIINGEERLPVPLFEAGSETVRFGFPHYDSFINARLDASHNYMLGTWDRLSPGGERTEMQFGASREQDYLFKDLKTETEAYQDINISGAWQVMFSDQEGDYPAQGEFRQEGQEVLGTFLTETGDYRFLAGTFEAGVLRLSVFDGAHAFLFRADVQPDGTLEGTFWSRDSYTADWVAKRGEAELGDPFKLTSLIAGESRFPFSFPSYQGEQVSSSDEQFEGKAMIVAIFGTWCPNCNDEVPVLKDLYQRYHERGLEIVGLANEFAPDFAGKAERVQAFAEHYAIPWPLLIIGDADKD